MKMQSEPREISQRIHRERRASNEIKSDLCVLAVVHPHCRRH